MNALRFTLTAVALTALLAGCGGTQNALNLAPSSVTQNAAHVSHGASWMLPEAKNDDLLYVSDTLGVSVYSFPQVKLVGQLNVDGAATDGLCADQNGNVFIPAWQSSKRNSLTADVYEYAHGTTDLIATLPDTGIPTSCATDPKTGTLAVVNVESIEIYKNATGYPIQYPSFLSSGHLEWATYDNNGDLFVDGMPEVGSGIFAELTYGSNTFETLSVNQSIGAGSIQWYNDTLVDDYTQYVITRYIKASYIYMYRIQFSGNSGQVVGQSILNGDHLPRFRQSIIVGNRVFTAGERNTLSSWRYPKGGKAVKKYRKVKETGIALSVAPSRTRIR